MTPTTVEEVYILREERRYLLTKICNIKQVNNNREYHSISYRISKIDEQLKKLNRA